MQAGLTADIFTKLLARLDPDRERAGERYEDLRRTLTRFFEWRNAPFPEEQTDEVFNRIARKLFEGVEIRNIGSYCYEVARLVCLEALKGRDSKRDRIERRKSLAASLGLQREALANRAQRLRDKLEQCVKSCLRRKMAI